MTLLDRRTARVLLTILVFALALTVVYVVRAVIIVFAFSILFAYLINPVVRFLQRHSLFFKNLRGPHVVGAYLAFIILIALVFHGLATQIIHLVSPKENYAAMQSLAGELHVMLQHYIRAKVILGGLSLSYCSVAMLVLGFPNAVTLGVLAGILEFIPVAGWMIAAATIVSAGALAHAHWIWMMALLLVWRGLMDYWIAPRVMGRELEIHPLLAIFTFMVGGAIGGVIGVYLSVPLVATLRVLYRRFASDTGSPGV